MAYTVITKKRFENSVRKLLEYLILNWQDNVAENFLLALNHAIITTSHNPLIGTEIKGKFNIRTTLVTKHNRIYYRIEKDKIIILNMIDTRRNPKENPFKKPA